MNRVKTTTTITTTAATATTTTTTKKTEPYKALIKCEFCKNTFDNNSIQDHECTEQWFTLLRCETCGKSFTSLIQLNRHSKVHVKFEYIVKKQPFVVQEERNLYKHLLCELCGKSYIRYNAFMKHKLSHNVDDKLNRTCRICDKVFSNIYNYQIHRAIHQGRENFKCDLCSKTFVLEYYLKRHMRTHQQQRVEFKCETCGKGYASKASLRDHMFVHEELGSSSSNKPHKCYLCDKTFLRRNTLVTHINMHKNRPPESHKCSECGKGFMFKSYLDRHSKTHWKEEGQQPKKKAVDVILFDENGREVDERLYLIDDTFDEGSTDFFEIESKPKDIFIEEEPIVVKTEKEEEPVDVKPFLTIN